MRVCGEVRGWRGEWGGDAARADLVRAVGLCVGAHESVAEEAPAVVWPYVGEVDIAIHGEGDAQRAALPREG